MLISHSHILGRMALRVPCPSFSWALCLFIAESEDSVLRMETLVRCRCAHFFPILRALFTSLVSFEALRFNLDGV